MQLNVWNDLAEAKRRWTEKTGTCDTTNKKTHRKHKDQKTPDTKGQPEQAEAHRPHDTDPSTPPGERKQTRKKPRKHKANQSITKTGGQTKHDNEKKRIKKYECTCPVCGQTHKYKRDQDLFMRRENRSKSTNVPFFSVQRLHGFRQVLQHVRLHVAN